MSIIKHGTMALIKDVQSYIDRYFEDVVETCSERSRNVSICRLSAPCYPSAPRESAHIDLETRLSRLDESFSQMLFRIIDEKGITDADCYKKADIDRRLFSKIRCDENYRPSKITVIAIILSLELSLKEAKDMLAKAGYALSHSNKFDVIIEYFLVESIYDLYTINDTLLYFDQPLIGQ